MGTVAHRGRSTGRVPIAVMSKPWKFELAAATKLAAANKRHEQMLADLDAHASEIERYEEREARYGFDDRLATLGPND